MFSQNGDVSLSDYENEIGLIRLPANGGTVAAEELRVRLVLAADVDGQAVAYTKQDSNAGSGSFANSVLYMMSRGGAGLWGRGNLDEVAVNWLFGEWSTPLVVVIAVSFALGAACGYLLAGRRASHRSKR